MCGGSDSEPSAVAQAIISQSMLITLPRVSRSHLIHGVDFDLPVDLNVFLTWNSRRCLSRNVVRGRVNPTSPTRPAGGVSPVASAPADGAARGTGRVPARPFIRAFSVNVFRS